MDRCCDTMITAVCLLPNVKLSSKLVWGGGGGMRLQGAVQGLRAMDYGRL